MKLRPWTFDKDKEVDLKWIGNAKIIDGQWCIRAGFEVDNRIEILEYPIAVLPLLKVGAFYKDGQRMESNTTGIIYDVKIPQLNQYKIVSALNACKEFGYYLYANPELMSQSVFEFVVEGKTYYLPQFEYIRAVFAVNKVITNAMMQPNGLEMLVKNSSLNNQRAYLELAEDIPNNIVKDENFIRYFAWLYFSPQNKVSFESIYMLLTLKQSNKEYLRLEVRLSDIFNTHIQFRGLQNDDKFLILQWLGSDMEGTTFTDIEVKHKAFKQRIAAPGKRKYRKSFKQDEVENILNDNHAERSKQDANQQEQEIQSTQFQFGKLAAVHKVFGDTQEVNQGDIYMSNIGQGGGIRKQQQIVGLDESIYGGTIQPIEFKTLEVTKDIRGQGLEKFIKIIQLLAQDTNVYQVAMNFVHLPLGRKFSFLPNGTRRICCLVYIQNKMNNKEFYVFEVATPDGKTLSTLIIEITNKTNKEFHISKIIKELVLNSGSWKTKELLKSSFKRLKHVKQDSYEWKIRLESNLQ
ncbi:Tn7-like element transposition protein TnsE [Robertmurraya massiliosenegalensis]|uniref:Tn7-like element transposition protein TnsE n=1 Tax=Robertmurraya TaxID=2837507 RepID=UPI0039A6B0C4